MDPFLQTRARVSVTRRQLYITVSVRKATLVKSASVVYLKKLVSMKKGFVIFLLALIFRRY